MENDYQTELAQICEQNGGVLIPEKVVEFARNKNTALHSRFDWDDTSAAHQWRLQQAREIIRVCVQYVPALNRTERVYVSLPSDRLVGGGYRRLVEVMKGDSRHELLESAKKEMESFVKRFHELEELSDVINPMKSALAA